MSNCTTPKPWKKAQFRALIPLLILEIARFRQAVTSVAANCDEDHRKLDDGRAEWVGYAGADWGHIRSSWASGSNWKVDQATSAFSKCSQMVVSTR